MEPIAPTSFIPKRPIEVASGSGTSIFFLISLLLFVLSLVAAGSAFAYKEFLKASIESKKTSLVRSEGAYDLPAIQDLIRIDSRMAQSKVLLQRHTAPSAVFDILSQLTLSQVQLNSFEYTAQSNGSAQIRLSGTGDNFSTVALQSDQFGASRVLRDIVFSGVNIDQQGDVYFSVVATVDPATISYAKNLGSYSVLPAPTSAQPSTDTTSTTTPNI